MTVIMPLANEEVFQSLEFWRVVVKKMYTDMESVTLFKDKLAVLLIDGWKNKPANRNLLVSILHTANGVKTFVDAKDYSRLSENATFVKSVVDEHIISA